MYSKFIIPIFLLLSTVSFSQVLTVEENIKNPSSIINDGIIEILIFFIYFTMKNSKTVKYLTAVFNIPDVDDEEIDYKKLYEK